MSFPSAVVGWITNGSHVVTVSRRNRSHDLGLPGGKVERGETLLQALTREVQEETGIEVLSASLLFSDTVQGEPTFSTSLFFVHKYKGEPQSLEPGIDVRWARFESLTSPDCTFRTFNSDAIMMLDQLGMLSSGFSIPVSDSR